uniref:Uncharacterized protein n=1 Tax=Knipowitschia caucasica TaxID=637954 RepID=A0AAV2KYW4_KNICA
MFRLTVGMQTLADFQPVASSRGRGQILQICRCVSCMFLAAVALVLLELGPSVSLAASSQNTSTLYTAANHNQMCPDFWFQIAPSCSAAEARGGTKQTRIWESEMAGTHTQTETKPDQSDPRGPSRSLSLKCRPQTCFIAADGGDVSLARPPQDQSLTRSKLTPAKHLLQTDQERLLH